MTKVTIKNITKSQLLNLRHVFNLFFNVLQPIQELSALFRTFIDFDDTDLDDRLHDYEHVHSGNQKSLCSTVKLC